MSLPNQRIVYLNGKFVPEDEATIPIKDQGLAIKYLGSKNI